MMTVDTLLFKIVNFNIPCIEDCVPDRDCRVLRSIFNNLNSGLYITENQSKLLVKILQDNAGKITHFTEEIKQSLASPEWNRSFRQVEQIKKMFLDKDEEGDLRITVEFSFNHEIKKTLGEILKKSEDMNVQINGKKYVVEFTETNIVTLIDGLSQYNFDIDDILKEHYTTIKSWSKLEIESQFLLTNIAHQNFQKAITSDLGIDTNIDQRIISDRSMRYKYAIQESKYLGEGLTELIAARSKNRIHVDRNKYSIQEIIASLIQLKRLPLLVVFDNTSGIKCIENLQILSDALENNRISNGIGVYFRLSNDEVGKKFNALIAEKNYNARLDSSLHVAAVISGKLPKFFLTNTWRPMSIIALDSNMGMRHGKTSVYSNCCDCIIEWADEPAILTTKTHLK